MKPWYPSSLEPATRPWFPSKSENKSKNSAPLLDENKKAYVNKWANAIEVPSDNDFPILSEAKSSRFPSILPTDEGAVVIQDTKTSRELGVFALMDLPAKHRVIFEKPVISFIHWRQRKGRKTIGAAWLALKPAVRSELRSTFKRLSDIRSEKNMSPSDRRKLEKFAEDYAFWDGGRSNAYIYRLVSHINHACPSCANAQHYVDSEEPHRISIRLMRNIRAGEELFIHYGKTNITFRCAVCEGRKPSDNGDKVLHENIKQMADSLFRTLGIRDSSRSGKSEKTKSTDETLSESLGGTTLVDKEDKGDVKGKGKSVAR